MMKRIAAILLLVMSAHSCLGFTGPHSPIVKSAASGLFKSSPLTTASVAGIVTGAVGFIGQVAAAEELELAELPPPYVPAVFAFVLLAGVGLLTSSLGNVMDEGGYCLLGFLFFVGPCVI